MWGLLLQGGRWIAKGMAALRAYNGTKYVTRKAAEYVARQRNSGPIGHSTSSGNTEGKKPITVGKKLTK